MNKRRIPFNGNEPNIFSPKKQFPLLNYQKPTNETQGVDGHALTSNYEQVKDTREHQKGLSKELSYETSMKPRRRFSHGAQRWGFLHGGSMRDPLNLKNIKPEDPTKQNADTESSLAETNKNINSTTNESLHMDDQLQFRANKRTWLTQQQHFMAPGMLVRTQKNLNKEKLHLQRGNYNTEQQQFQKLANFHENSMASTSSSTDIDELNKGNFIESPTNENMKKRNHKKANMSHRYRYGNFNYYHLRKEFNNPFAVTNSFFQDDPRVDFFCPDWFTDKSVLDIGCNAGRFTISLARRFQTKHVIGIDLDQHLIGVARKNIRHFTDKDTKLIGKFPISFEANFGPISAPSTSTGPHFPDNIWFFCENYVLSEEDLLKVEEEYDIIFALSITKWVHLNWGDEGIRHFLLRAYRQLRTGGRFVLETASFREYEKHCKKRGNDKPPEEVLNTFAGIHFLPEEFTDYLINTVGFSHHEELNTPHSKYLGISGRLQVYYKGKFMLTDDGRTPAREPECT